MTHPSDSVFSLQIELPNKTIVAPARLVGFAQRLERLKSDLQMMIDPEALEKWSSNNYGVRLPIVEAVTERYPLVIFYGDVGTGKTITAEAISNALAKELGRDAVLFKLSTRVRGTGNVGEMSVLINRAFQVVMEEAGKKKLSFLIIDEADSLVATRDASQSHHEDKVAVNTVIQKLDDTRQLKGRVLVILCTNRFETLDPAIVRRAGHIEKFERPNDGERRQLIRMDCEGIGLSTDEIDQLVLLTGSSNPHGRPYTYSDIRTKIMPDALRRAFPKRKLSVDDFFEAIRAISPSPILIDRGS